MAVERFTRERILRYVRVILVAVGLGVMVGVITSAVVGLGVQYLGPLEGYRLGALVGAFIGGVYGGVSGLGIRGVIGGFIVGAIIGAGIGDAAWNDQLANVQNPDNSFSIVHFPAMSFAKMLVLGAVTGALVGGIAGAIPADQKAQQAAA